MTSHNTFLVRKISPFNFYEQPNFQILLNGNNALQMTLHASKYDNMNFSIHVFPEIYAALYYAARDALQMTLHKTFLVRLFSPLDFSKQRNFRISLNGNNALQMTLHISKNAGLNFSIHVFQLIYAAVYYAVDNALQMTLHNTFLVREISPFDFSKQPGFSDLLNGLTRCTRTFYVLTVTFFVFPKIFCLLLLPYDLCGRVRVANDFAQCIFGKGNFSIRLL